MLETEQISGEFIIYFIFILFALSQRKKIVKGLPQQRVVTSGLSSSSSPSVKHDGISKILLGLKPLRYVEEQDVKYRR